MVVDLPVVYFRYKRFFYLQRIARVVIYPKMRVEAKMENKWDYMQEMMQSTPYDPLARRILKMKTPADADSIIRHSVAPIRSGSTAVTTEVNIGNDDGPNESVPIFYTLSDRHFAPTIFFDAAEFTQLTKDRQERFLNRVTALLQLKNNTMQLPNVVDGKFAIKGCHSTRTGVFTATGNKLAMIDFIIQHSSPVSDAMRCDAISF